jgi:hypothetical protein
MSAETPGERTDGNAGTRWVLYYKRSAFGFVIASAYWLTVMAFFSLMAVAGLAGLVPMVLAEWRQGRLGQAVSAVVAIPLFAWWILSDLRAQIMDAVLRPATYEGFVHSIDKFTVRMPFRPRIPIPMISIRSGVENWGIPQHSSWEPGTSWPSAVNIGKPIRVRYLRGSRTIIALWFGL